VVCACFGVSIGIFAGCGHSYKEIAAFPHVGSPQCILFSRDGKYLVAGSQGVSNAPPGYWEGELFLWELATHKQLASVRLPRWVQSLAFSGDGELLAIACGSRNTSTDPNWHEFKEKDGELRLYSFPGLEEKGALVDGTLIQSVRFAPNAKTLAICVDDSRGLKGQGHAADFRVKLCDVKPLRVKTTLRNVGHGHIDFSPDGKTLAVGQRRNLGLRVGEGVAVDMFDSVSGELKEKFEVAPLEGFIDSLQYSANGNLMLLTHGGIVVLWDIGKGAPHDLSTFNKALGKRTRCNFTLSPDGTLLVGCVTRSRGPGPLGENWVFVWAIKAERVVAQWRWPSDGPLLTGVVASADNRLLAVGTREGKGRLSDGRPIGGSVHVFELQE
jgi:WD40 repeat protein